MGPSYTESLWCKKKKKKKKKGWEIKKKIQKLDIFFLFGPFLKIYFFFKKKKKKKKKKGWHITMQMQTLAIS